MLSIFSSLGIWHITHKPTFEISKGLKCAFRKKGALHLADGILLQSDKKEESPMDKQQRLANAKAQNKLLDKLVTLIEVYQVENLRHAKSDSESDYLDMLIAEHMIADNIGNSLHWDTWDQQVFIADEARSECRFDIHEQAYINENGDIISGGELPSGLSLPDHLYDQKREEDL
jgi:hypothetical protein